LTALLILFGAFIVADTILHCLVWLVLRDALYTLVLQGNQRREWHRPGEKP
jgi:hypothetical protein